jgi:hypothetical protein
VNKVENISASGMKSDDPAVKFARCFLRLANLPNFALDRLSRYEAVFELIVGRMCAEFRTKRMEQVKCLYL